MPSSDADLITIEIIGLPLALHARAQEHGDELNREFRLMAEQLHDDPAGAHVPRRLIELTDSLTASYGGFTERQEDLLESAIRSGEDTIDLRYQLPRHVAAAATSLAAMLDEADEFCRAGQHLLTLATPADCVAYRRWFLEEFVRQADGAAPTSWPGLARPGPAS